MTWLTHARPDAPHAGHRLAERLRREGIVTMPGAHNPLAARQCEQAGFEAAYLSGGALSASLALPDLGLLTLDELLFFARRIVQASDVMLLVDGDTGYGEALNVTRLVKELDQAGAAAVQLEDQLLPKKCGHLSDKRLATTTEMQAKIAAARAARRGLRIVARTDAVASEGIDAAIERARAYVEAGADIIFPEALPDEAAMRRVVEAVDAPLLANMTEFGRTPLRSAAQLEAIGFRLVIWPVSSLRVSARATESLYATLARDGVQGHCVDAMMTRAELYGVLDYFAHEALDASIAQSVLPGA